MNSAKTEAEVIARRISDHLHAPAWTQCPSTHCERSQECRSPNECSGAGAGWIYREVYAAIMAERRAGEDLAQMLVQRDKEADEALIAAARERDALKAALKQAVEALEPFANHAKHICPDGMVGEFLEFYDGGLRRSLTSEQFRRARSTFATLKSAIGDTL